MPFFAVQWRTKGGWVDLDQLPVKRGRWRHGVRFTHIHTAHEWGMKPSEFMECSESDQAFMIQYCNTIGRMESWENEQMLKDSK